MKELLTAFLIIVFCSAMYLVDIKLKQLENRINEQKELLETYLPEVEMNKRIATANVQNINTILCDFYSDCKKKEMK